MQQDSAQCHDCVSHAFKNEALLENMTNHMGWRLICNLQCLDDLKICASITMLHNPLQAYH